MNPSILQQSAGKSVQSLPCRRHYLYYSRRFVYSNLGEDTLSLTRLFAMQTSMKRIQKKMQSLVVSVLAHKMCGHEISMGEQSPNYCNPLFLYQLCYDMYFQEDTTLVNLTDRNWDHIYLICLTQHLIKNSPKIPVRKMGLTCTIYLNMPCLHEPLGCPLESQMVSP